MFEVGEKRSSLNLGGVGYLKQKITKFAVPTGGNVRPGSSLDLAIRPLGARTSRRMSRPSRSFKDPSTL